MNLNPIQEISSDTPNTSAALIFSMDDSIDYLLNESIFRVADQSFAYHLIIITTYIIKLVHIFSHEIYERSNHFRLEVN